MRGWLIAIVLFLSGVQSLCATNLLDSLTAITPLPVPASVMQVTELLPAGIQSLGFTRQVAAVPTLSQRALDEIPTYPLISKWDFYEWQFPDPVSHDRIADHYFNQDTIPDDLKERFPFLDSKIFELNQKAMDAFNQLGNLAQILEELKDFERMSFPVGITFPIKRGIEIALVLEGIEYSGGMAIMHNLFLRIKLPGYEKPLIFGAPEITFSRTGGFREAKIGLIGDVELPINGSKHQLLILKGYSHVTKRGCIATISCDGFESVQLSATVYLSKRLVRPVDNVGNVLNGYVKGDVDIKVEDLSNIIASANFKQKFVLTKNKNIIFSLEEAILDASESQNDALVKFPTNYFSDDLGGADAITENQWQGLYIQKIGVVPNKFANKSISDKLGGFIDHLIIDRSGITGTLGVVNPIPLGAEKLANCRFSVDKVSLEIYKNDFKLLEAVGRVVPPALEDGKAGAGLAYSAKVGDKGWQFTASIKGTEEAPFPLFKGAIELHTGTELIIGKAENEDQTVVQVLLCGKANLKKVWTAKAAEEAAKEEVNDTSGIRFKGFHVQSVRPYIKNIGAWDIPTHQELPFGPLFFTLDDVKVGMTNDEEILLHFTGGGTFSRDEGFNISAKVGLNIYGIHDPGQDDRLVYDRTEVDRVQVCVATKSWGARVDLNWFDDDPVYGSGFMGKAAVGLESMGYEQSDDICNVEGGDFCFCIVRLQRQSAVL